MCTGDKMRAPKTVGSLNRKKNITVNSKFTLLEVTEIPYYTVGKNL